MLNQEVIILFLLTTLSSVLGNYRSIFLIKDNSWKKYFITFLDSFVFAFVIKGFTTGGEQFYTVISYTIGKLFGMFLTDVTIQKFQNTIYILNIYLSNEEHIQSLRNFLVEENLSYTIFEGNSETERKKITIHLNYKQKEKLLNFLERMGVENPTMEIVEGGVTGKILERV